VLLWSLRDRIRTVQVLSDEPWIPWELLKLHGKENGRIVEGPFLCEAFAQTRWFPGIGRRPELRLQRLAVVVLTDSGLAWAQQERDYLRSQASGQRQINEIPATYLDVVDALSGGEHDGWHFIGHGQFAAPDPNRSAILLEDKNRLCAEDICGQVSNCGLAHPLVFLNACQSGREAFAMTGIGRPPSPYRLLRLAVRAGVDAVGQQLARLIAVVAGVLQAHLGANAEGHPLLLAVESVLQPPPLAAGRGNSRYSPRSSNSLAAFSPGLVLRIVVSVRGMGATHLPPPLPGCQGMV
jgi:hypothetical protein